MVGFSQNLENPYWSVLSVYIIVNPPGAAAIRSKCLFRLLGTVIGGVLVVAVTGLFGDQIGILLTGTIAVIVGAMFLNQIDKTPTGYIWFAVAVTAAVIALSNLMHPERIFELAAGAGRGDLTRHPHDRGGRLRLARTDDTRVPEDHGRLARAGPKLLARDDRARRSGVERR